MDHKAKGRVKWWGQLALKCRNYSKSWREDSLQPGGSYTGIVWLELGTGPFPCLSCPHQAGQLVELLSCASLEAADMARNQIALAGQACV